MSKKKIFKKMYVEINSEKFEKTGEIEVIGGPITGIEGIASANENAYRSHFEITRTAYEAKAWKAIAGERGKVIGFLLENRNMQNEIRLTTKEVSEQADVSGRTVGRVIDALEQNELAVQGNRSIMLNPHWVHKGDNFREMAIFAEFERMLRYYEKGRYGQNKNSLPDEENDA